MGSGKMNKGMMGLKWSFFVIICETETAVVVARAAIAENWAWEILLIVLLSKTVQILEREGQSR